MSSRDHRVEDTYEAQNDTRLDELHSKLRTLRGITTDIHDDVERQNQTLDDTGDHFTAFGSSLAETSRRAGQAFGIGGSLRTWRIAMFVVAGFFAFLILSKVYHWWFPSLPPPPA